MLRCMHDRLTTKIPILPLCLSADAPTYQPESRIIIIEQIFWGVERVENRIGRFTTYGKAPFFWDSFFLSGGAWLLACEDYLTYPLLNPIIIIN